MSRRADTEANFGSWISFIDNAYGGDDVDIDNDGVMATTRIKIDIAQGLSQRLGKQLPHMGTYRVNYIGISLVNVDDVNDNDMGANFGGRIKYWEPSHHRIEAMKLARKMEKHLEMVDEIDADSYFLSTQKDYVGMRFTWDADNQVGYPTSETLVATSTGHFGGTQWQLEDLFQIYDIAEGPPTQDNALWNGRTGYPNQFGWSISRNNQEESGFGVHDFVLNLGNAPLEVLSGLMVLDFETSSTDTSQVTDDDYQVLITVGVTGWSDF